MCTLSEILSVYALSSHFFRVIWDELLWLIPFPRLISLLKSILKLLTDYSGTSRKWCGSVTMKGLGHFEDDRYLHWDCVQATSNRLVKEEALPLPTLILLSFPTIKLIAQKSWIRFKCFFLVIKWGMTVRSLVVLIAIGDCTLFIGFARGNINWLALHFVVHGLLISSKPSHLGDVDEERRFITSS